MPGDTHRNLQIHPTFSGQTFKHVLVPVWLLTYIYGNKPWQVVVNAYTGTYRGPVPEELVEDSAVWWLLALAIAVMIVLLIGRNSRQLPVSSETLGSRKPGS